MAHGAGTYPESGKRPGDENSGHRRSDRGVGEHTEKCAAHFCFFTFLASRSISRGEITCSSTMPTRNCSTDPEQKRSMMWRTARAATLLAGIAARYTNVFPASRWLT